MRTTAKSLRTDTKRILEAVERGEEVVVSKRGNACARIVPIVPVEKKAAKNLRETALFGIWKERKDVRDVDEYVDSLRSGRD